FESGVSHSCGNHEIAIFRCAGNGKSPDVSLRVSLCRIDQRQINGLARFELKAFRLGEMKAHRPLCQVFLPLEPGLQSRGCCHLDCSFAAVRCLEEASWAHRAVAHEGSRSKLV